MVDMALTCVHCNTTHEVQTEVLNGGQVPEPGDPSLCYRCGEWNVFDENLKFREPTVDEYILFGKDNMMNQTRAAWEYAKQEELNEALSQQNPMDPNANILDINFASVKRLIDHIGRERGIPMPPNGADILRTVFALGAMSSLDMMHPEKYGGDMHLQSMLIIKYRRDIAKFMAVKKMEKLSGRNQRTV